MDSVEQILREHDAWYDSMDQSIDSWGCICDRKTGYSSRNDVIANHIMPKVRAAIDGKPERRPQNSIDANGNRRVYDENGRLMRAASDRHAWDNVSNLVTYAKSEGLERIASAFEEYEDERLRLGRVVANLDDQISQLGEGFRKNAEQYKRVEQILKDAGMDLAVILATDDAFAENVEVTGTEADPVRTVMPSNLRAIHKSHLGTIQLPVNPIFQGSIVYCEHGNDMQQSCIPCRRSRP